MKFGRVETTWLSSALFQNGELGAEKKKSSKSDEIQTNALSLVTTLKDRSGKIWSENQTTSHLKICLDQRSMRLFYRFEWKETLCEENRAISLPISLLKTQAEREKIKAEISFQFPWAPLPASFLHKHVGSRLNSPE